MKYSVQDRSNSTGGARTFIAAKHLLSNTEKETQPTQSNAWVKPQALVFSNAALYNSKEVHHRVTRMRSIVSTLSHTVVKPFVQQTFNIDILFSRRLRSPISATLENDADGYIARCIDLPIFGFGDETDDAIDSLKSELESLYEDLMEDDELTPEWRTYKDYLISKIDG